MATPEQVAKVCGVMAAAYPNYKLTPQTIHVYARTLGDLPADMLEAAALQCIATSEFFPTVAALRKAAFEIMAHAQGIPTAHEAWGEVRRAMGTVGHMGKPKFSHPIVERAVAALGWRDLCLSDNPTADRARFLECYQQLLNRAQVDAAMLPEVKQVARKFALRQDVGTVCMLVFDDAGAGG